MIRWLRRKILRHCSCQTRGRLCSRCSMHRAVPDLPADQVLEAIDRGRGMPGKRFWTLDPVDGTQGFVRGDQYVVALALIVGGRVEIGLLGCPELSLGDGRRDAVGSIVYAVRNRGAFGGSPGGDEFAPLRVSSVVSRAWPACFGRLRATTSTSRRSTRSSGLSASRLRRP